MLIELHAHHRTTGLNLRLEVNPIVVLKVVEPAAYPDTIWPTAKWRHLYMCHTCQNEPRVFSLNTIPVRAVS